MQRKLGLLAAAAALALSAPAGAVVFMNVGDTVTLNYNGFVTPDGGGGTIAGLTAKATFTVTAKSGNNYDFSYSIDNTSSVSSRVSVFGFNVTPDVSSASKLSGALFTSVTLDGNVPNLTGPDNLRVCFSQVNCAGGGGSGVLPADPPSTGTFRLTFASPQASIDLSRFFVRYQSITGVPGVESATGLGTAVPEPATWAMMLGGFGLIGAAMRRRQRTAITYA
jgi:hypothetical protein